jgi:arylsulfatase A-like enzyme
LLDSNEFDVQALIAVTGKFLRPESRNEGHRAMRAGDWKLVAQSGQPWELLDMKKDRSEAVNVIENEPARAAQLQKDWHAWANRAKVVPWADVVKRMQTNRP